MFDLSVISEAVLRLKLTRRLAATVFVFNNRNLLSLPLSTQIKSSACFQFIANISCYFDYDYNYCSVSSVIYSSSLTMMSASAAVDAEGDDSDGSSVSSSSSSSSDAAAGRLIARSGDSAATVW